MAGGFTTRKGTQYEPRDVILNKYFLCSKEGTKPFKEIDSTQEANSSNNKSRSKITRKVPSIRTGCEVCIRVKLNDDKLYEVYHFEESHNHLFVAEDDRYLLPCNRGINYVQEEAVNTLSAINVGPVRAFNIMRTLYGGFNMIGATKVDFKNFKRDLNRYIAEYDADMVIKRLKRKKEFMPNFSMEYLTTDDGVLRALFWADEDAKRNFNMFGDVVSFDANYRRNKYNMMFVPFTGVDNHYRNVNLGAAIIGNETAETYSWLLNVFRQAFGRAPPVIVGATLCNGTDFKKRLCAICWTDALLPDQFESEWGVILTDFDLANHEWQFPERYILRRWSREVVPSSAPGAILGINEGDDWYHQVNRVVREITQSAEFVINMLVTNFDALCAFWDHVVQYQSTADEAVRRECGNCKRKGHNRRTCKFPARENNDDTSEGKEGEEEADDEAEEEVQ
ncbi:protein FAR1-RELATED SEQUENCE 5-like [Helianthus annuus]|uniref:protein FAR1-RELATED SEQUENCE 5-like n=1 Tax=Helianthus annuus TaxID=4232 RepID=UPI000B8F3BA0|nr:protein FAR1-RELATED SEQUENCE 5-like [Helianthus annuus]